jgi:hypothetical protein
MTLPHYLDSYPLAVRNRVFRFSPLEAGEIGVATFVCVDCGYGTYISTYSEYEELVCPLCAEVEGEIMYWELSDEA